MSSNILTPFQLLELNIISAQDLSPVSRSMRAYALAWVHPQRKLSTRVDAHGRNNPTWNDKFVFRVDEAFLQNDTAAVMIEIFALHWFRDIHVGSVRVLVGNLIPPQKNHRQPNHMQLGMRFVALQVRRPSGRPQGILNIGVALLDSSMRSMPLYTQLSSAVGYRHLMGEEDPFQNNQSTTSNNQNSYSFLLAKPELRRARSDTSSMLGSELNKRSRFRAVKGSSIVNAAEPIDLPQGKKNKKGGSKASSMVSGSDFNLLNKAGNKEKLGSFVNNGSDIFQEIIQIEGKIGKGGAIVNGLEAAAIAPPEPPTKGKTGKGPKGDSIVNGSSTTGSDNSDRPKKGVISSPPVNKPKQNGSPYKSFSSNKFKPFKDPVVTQSELGPSPSEVAAAKARENLLNKTIDDESSINAGWEIDSSVEGLQSKLQRWRAELPPLYDTSLPSSSVGEGGTTAGRHSRRYTDGGIGPGLFSCFSNLCGCEISIVCGAGQPTRKSKKKSGSTGRLIRSPRTNDSSVL